MELTEEGKIVYLFLGTKYGHNREFSSYLIFVSKTRLFVLCFFLIWMHDLPREDAFTLQLPSLAFDPS